MAISGDNLTLWCIDATNPTAGYMAISGASTSFVLYTGTGGLNGFDIDGKSGTTYFAVINNNGGTLYVGAFYLSGGQAVKTTPQLVSGATTTSDLVAISVDAVNSFQIYVLYNATSGVADLYYQVVTITPSTITTVLGQTLITTPAHGIVCFTCSANNGAVAFVEVFDGYRDSSSTLLSIAGGNQAHYVVSFSLNAAGTVATLVTQRGVGLASKSFFYNSTACVVTAYGFSPITSIQCTLFVQDQYWNIIGKIAPGSAAGYASNAAMLASGTAPSGNQVILSTVTTNGGQYSVYQSGSAQFSYLSGFGIQPTNDYPNGLVESIGVSYATVTFQSPSGMAEVAGCQNIAGMILNQYDQVNLVEHGFCTYPDTVSYTVASTSSGDLTAQTYQYSCVYRWADNQGNFHQSAPSVPITVVATNTKNIVSLYIPTLRLTAKANVWIDVYRWSTAQPVFYLIAGATVNDTVANNPNANNVEFQDVYNDSLILGNQIIYTNGGVVDDIQAPACFDPVMYHDRVWVTLSEDSNQQWFSKQVIPSTPIEFSDLFTYYVAPTQVGTGGVYCKAVMDEKLIFFKSNAISYLTGQGPDNTGANNDFTEPTEIVSPVGCMNRASLVIIPTGIMFQASNSSGIWLLGRDMSVSYKGFPQSSYNSQNVMSAVLIPGTTQVRFLMSGGNMIMYDYFVDQWLDFVNAGGSFGSVSCIYNRLHTYLDTNAQVQQETPGFYVDQSNPVTMNFTTSWIAMAGIQGYERAYWFYILANYLSAHALQVQIAYDYNPTIVQTLVFTPSSAYTPEQWKIHFIKQQCESFQLTITEINTGTNGPGLTISGLNIIAAFKSAYRPQPAAQVTS